MQSVAVRLGLIVREVCFAADSVKPSEALRKNIEALQGKPIAEEPFMDLLRGTASALPDGVRGVKIMMERIPDDSGVYLVVTLIAERPLRKGLSPQLTYGSRLQIGEKNLGGGIGGLAGIGKEVGRADINWSGFTKNLRMALEAQPDVYLFVQAHWAEIR